jgi:hypothetical protein
MTFSPKKILPEEPVSQREPHTVLAGLMPSLAFAFVRGCFFSLNTR